MEWKVVEYGINLETNEIWIIQKNDQGTYSGYINGLSHGYPGGMKIADIEEYLKLHDTEGYSCDGTYEQVKDEIM